MVFQNYALFPHMSVEANVAFGLSMRKVPKTEIRERVKKALALVQLKGEEAKLPAQLSGGQKQRVAIARAIVIEPPLILMDEPLSNLDARLRLEMRSEIRRIHNELRRSTIYVTHDQDEALSLSDRIVVLDRGKTRQIATPREVYSAPADIAVARFMGYRTVLEMDILSGSGGYFSLSGRGFSLTAKAAQKNAVCLSNGSKALVAIRPEDFSPGAAGENVIEAIVKSVEYCGFSSQAQLKTDAGDIIHIRSAGQLEENARIKICVSPDRALVYSGACSGSEGESALYQ
jgi:putative spermidine/putrescine transport system ATP-binding protein